MTQGTQGTQQETTTGECSVMGFDGGFSANKVITPKGDIFKFPSAVAVMRTAAVDLGDDDEEESVYRFEGDLLKVGEDAVDDEDKMYERNINFVIKNSPLFVAHALKRCTGEIPSIIAAGLPVEQYRKYRTELKERLSAFTVNGENYKFDVPVYAQGIGALADYVTSTDPPGDERGFVIDIGFNTVIGLRYEKLQAKSDGSCQYTELGISRPMEEVIRALKNKYNIHFDHIGINQLFMKGKTRLGGATINVQETAAPIMKEYLERLFARLRNDFGRHFAKADRILVVGGGAYHFEKDFLSEQGDIIYIPERPEFANVRGYRQLASDAGA